MSLVPAKLFAHHSSIFEFGDELILSTRIGFIEAVKEKKILGIRRGY
jgi:hypothetical protein